MGTNRKSSLGFVLPLTLIVLALLSALSFGLSRMASESLKNLQARKQLWAEEKQVRNVLDKTVFILLVGSYDPQNVKYNDEVMPLNNTPFSVDGFSVRVQSWSGLYSLSFLGEVGVKSVLGAIMDIGDAQRITAELGDWIDQNDRRRFRGMERADYQGKRMLQSPRNAPLRSIDELVELPSVKPVMMNGQGNKLGLRDIFLAGGEDNFDLGTAPDILIGPVLGLDNQNVREILKARRKSEWSNVRLLVDGNHWAFNDHPIFYKGLKYRFVFEGKNGFTSRAQVKLAPFGSEAVFSIIDWQVPSYNYE